MANPPRSPFANFEPLSSFSSFSTPSTSSNSNASRPTSTHPQHVARQPAADSPSAPSAPYEPARIRIMRVAVRLPKTFTKEHLVVACWETYPESFGLTTSDGKSWPHSVSVCKKLYGATGLIASGNIIQNGAALSVGAVVFDRPPSMLREYHEAKRLLRLASEVLQLARETSAVSATTPQSAILDTRVDEVLAAFDAFARRQA